MNEPVKFSKVATTCDHPSDCIEWDAYGYGDEVQLTCTCTACGAEENATLDRNWAYTADFSELHGGDEVCMYCGETEINCVCYECAKCGAIGDDVYEDECSHCEHKHTEGEE